MSGTDERGAGSPERFGKYEVERLIAAGGMAEVFLAATPPPVVRRVAIKRIRPAFAGQADFVQMFEDEARVAACFDHPNVVRLIDFEAGPPPYLIMEYVDGPDLRRLLWEAGIREQWMPVRIAVAIVAEAARGLHYAHTWTDPNGEALEVIHRDMSPQNILVGQSGAVKVVDFGIAKAAGRNTRTQAGVIKGKYAYMAPEQVRGETLTPRTDVFALGIILYESLTYKNPFRRERDEMTLLAVTEENPEPPRALRPEIPEALEAVVLRALAKDPQARWPSAGAMAEALEGVLAAGRGPVRPEQIGDFVRGTLALPVPEGAPGGAPASEGDREVSEADVRRVSEQISKAEIAEAAASARAGAEAEGSSPAVHAVAAAPAPHAVAEAPAARPVDPLQDQETRLGEMASPAPEVPLRQDAPLGSYPQAAPPDWKLPVLIVLGLALLGGLIGAALAFLLPS